MLFMYAFDQKFPKAGFTKLSHQVTHLAGKLPLGLKVMGSYFRGMAKHEWERVIPRLWNRLDGDIESILKFSYDGLTDEDKDLFVHIACFFNYQKVEKVEKHLAESFMDVRQGLHVLVEKSFISIDRGIIKMHSLLAQLGRDIVRKQSDRNPGKRQFLVDDKDIGELLTDPTAITTSVIGIYSTQNMNWHKLSERAFKGIYNLQFLRLTTFRNMASLPGFVKYISPKLQLLDCEYWPNTCLPFTVNLECLVELTMTNSMLEKLWADIKLLRNLKWVNLSRSNKLKELPNLSTATSLEELDLSGCSSLMELPSSIGKATTLQKLNLDGCVKLVELPSSIGNLTNLQELNISFCMRLVKLPSSIGNATNLQKLDLSYCSSLVELPSSLENATKLEDLDLSGCLSLVNFPSLTGNANLQELDLCRCSSLVKLPYSIGNTTNLQKLDLRYCSSLVELPCSLGNATNLQKLDLSYCSSLVELPSSIGNATNVQKLDLSHCSSLVELPSSIGNATSLQELDLRFCISFVSSVIAQVWWSLLSLLGMQPISKN
uniref:Protein SUPPRESSOR OF npr1-1, CONSTITUTIVE 1 n=1 Tax=Noccaea caerulescens TaxID=107243 RepID=A0A1J3EHJ7_NOCCA